MDRKKIFSELSDIQKNVELREGILGLIRLLGLIERFQSVTMRKVSQESNIPVPICTAVRNEFIKQNWCERDANGTITTSLGKEVLQILGVVGENITCSKCSGEGLIFPKEKYQKELELLTKYCEMRGIPNTLIDQSYATSETSLSRVLFMNHNFDLIHQNFAFLGDSDLTSIALGMFAPSTCRIVVFDIDQRLKEIIDLANKQLNLSIEFVEIDLKKPLQNEFINQFNCIITDPPYTLNGTSLFVSRGIELITSDNEGVIYLSFPTKAPNEMVQFQKNLSEMNCLMTDIIPKFNKYIGAQKIGGVSTLFRLLVVPPAIPKIKGSFNKPIYTGEASPTIRFYQCLDCRKTIKVGHREKYQTIEQLKKQSCPNCKSVKFRKTDEKKQNDLKYRL
ncbi:MAG: bis-aminopropyl spermidine synthase family protein [Asgard group archaeon]|nr:bis-aminopropyl spermidine synthase family protein [Asgard group archaeon]